MVSVSVSVSVPVPVPVSKDTWSKGHTIEAVLVLDTNTASSTALEGVYIRAP